MSNFAKCDACGKMGRRPRMHPAPRKWWFLTTKTDDPEEELYTCACSLLCIAKLVFRFRRGPGARWAANK